jgi:L-fuculose-phosphate aldolase
MITVGATLDAVLALSIEAETLAEMYWRAPQIGAPPMMSDDEMDRVVANFTDCGRAAPTLHA